MEITGEHKFNAPRQQVWDALLSPESLQQCLPGCEAFEQTGDDAYKATMRIGVAMIKGVFEGSVKIVDKVEPESYSMHVEGSGPQGQVTGVGKLTLTEENGVTTVHYHGDANVRGTIARVGARMIQPAARTIAGQFFGCLASKVPSG